MKKTGLILFVSLLLSMSTTTSSAQEKGTQDIGVSIGVVTSNDILNLLPNFFTILAGVVYETTSEIPAITVDYKYALKNRWMLYGDVAIQSSRNRARWIADGKPLSEEIHNFYTTIGVGTEYHYISGSWFQMYSGVSLAMTIQHASSDSESNNWVYPNFQVNPLGFRVGKNLGGSLEIGYGYKGLINAGLSYQF